MSGAVGMELRPLRRDEIPLIWTIDRREHIANIYRVQDGVLVLEPHGLDVPGWPPGHQAALMPALVACHDRGGTFLAAFETDRLVGLAALDTIWRGKRRDLLQLEFLHVGRDHRGTGLGTTLFEAMVSAARDGSAAGLYISATPSENTVRFYQHRGAQLLREPDADLLAKEPEDIHFECRWR